MNKLTQTIVDAFKKGRHRGMVISYKDRFLGIVRIHVYGGSKVNVNWETGEILFYKVLLRYDRGGHTSSCTQDTLIIKQSQLCELQPWN